MKKVLYDSFKGKTLQDLISKTIPCPYNKYIHCSIPTENRIQICCSCDNYVDRIEVSNYANLPQESSTYTTTSTEICKHTGFYHMVTFLFFKRRFLACEKCGKLVPQTKWTIV